MWQFFLIVVFVLFLCAGWSAHQEYQQKMKEVAPFNSCIDNYCHKQEKITDKPVQIKSKKIFPVNVDNDTHDESYFLLNPAVKPLNPSEVGAIAKISYTPLLIGYYTDGSPGYIYVANVNVLDAETGGTISNAVINGENPPLKKKRSGSGYGPHPYQKIANYLETLVD